MAGGGASQTLDGAARQLRELISAGPAQAGSRSAPRVVQALRGGAGGYDELMERASSARLVLLGGASHGTLEFYRERAVITRRLIEEAGFVGVAVVGDCFAARRVHRFVCGACPEDEADARPSDALGGFLCFPSWPWRNTEVRDFVGWLRRHNRAKAAAPVGFYGLDSYGLDRSADVVIRYLDRVDASAAARARARYGHLEVFGEDSASDHAASLGLERAWEAQVVARLCELLSRAVWAALEETSCRAVGGPRASWLDEEERFFARQGAEVVLRAEEYYRTMLQGRVASFNQHTEHMMRALDSLLQHLEERVSEGAAPTAGRAKLVVWAHNTHVGDPRATEGAGRGERTLGQLARERHAGDCFSIGLSTHAGWVTAASRWGASAERMRVNPSTSESYERLLHEVAKLAGEPRILLYPPAAALADILEPRRLERALGVVYCPEREHAAYTFSASLPRRFDALIHIDETEALIPLEQPTAWRSGETREAEPLAL